MNIYQSVARVIEKGESAVLCTVVETSGSTPRHAGSKMLVSVSGQFEGTVGGGEIEQRILLEAPGVLMRKEPKLMEFQLVNPDQGDPGVCGGTAKIYMEPIYPPSLILVVGGGHVGKAVVHLVHWLGFRVAISDDRPDLCNPSVHPEADEHLICSLGQLPKYIQITSETYIVLTTRGSSIDVEGLDALLQTPAAYIGVIGSNRRWITTRNGLIEKGVSESALSRVHSPIGLELGAETPEEIAVSIMAEILMVRHHGSGKEMKL